MSGEGEHNKIKLPIHDRIIAGIIIAAVYIPFLYLVVDSVINGLE